MHFIPKLLSLSISLSFSQGESLLREELLKRHDLEDTTREDDDRLDNREHNHTVIDADVSLSELIFDLAVEVLVADEVLRLVDHGCHLLLQGSDVGSLCSILLFLLEYV